MEVKKQEEEEEEEGTETKGEGKGLGKMGKGQPDLQTEENPEVRHPRSSCLLVPPRPPVMRPTQRSSSQIKKEKMSGDGCKGESMDTSASSASSSVAAGEDQKTEVKKEPAEEEEGSGSAAGNSSPAGAQSKKKGEWSAGDSHCSQWTRTKHPARPIGRRVRNKRSRLCSYSKWPWL